MHQNLKSILKSGLFLSAGLPLFTSCNQDENDNDPNIILIVADDLGYADMSCSGLAEDVQTPNLDKLSENGVRFTQVYASSPISSPSRGGLLTGCYQQRWGTFWYGGPGLHDTVFKTIPELLKHDHYATGYVGKVHYGSFDRDTTHRSFPLNHGFDYFFGHTSPRKHYMNHSQELEAKFQKVKKNHNKRGQSLRQGPLWENTDKVDTIAFSTELFGKKACEFIDKHQDEKFFLQLSFNAVHNFTHQLPEQYLKDHSLKGYRDWDPAVEDYYDWYQQGRYPNNPEGRDHYLGQLHFMDSEIGRVLSYLEELDLDENTIIVFVSDNGGSTPIYANNYPLRGSKYLLYEGGIRVPMIISWPSKYPKGVVSDNVVSAMDVLPTLCETTGVDVPENIDGIDLNPLLRGIDNTIQQDTLIWDTGIETAVRVGKWKLHIVRSDQNAKYEMVEVELGEHLYNLEEDISETTDLAEQNPEIFEQLKEIHRKWKDKLGSQ